MTHRRADLEINNKDSELAELPDYYTKGGGFYYFNKV